MDTQSTSKRSREDDFGKKPNLKKIKIKKPKQRDEISPYSPRSDGRIKIGEGCSKVAYHTKNDQVVLSPNMASQEESIYAHQEYEKYVCDINQQTLYEYFISCVMLDLGLKRILPIKGVYVSEHDNEVGKPHKLRIFMDHADGGSLKEASLNQDQDLKIGLEISEVILDFYETGILNGDIHLGNILLKSQHDGQLKTLLTDFEYVDILCQSQAYDTLNHYQQSLENEKAPETETEHLKQFYEAFRKLDCKLQDGFKKSLSTKIILLTSEDDIKKFYNQEFNKLENEIKIYSDYFITNPKTSEIHQLSYFCENKKALEASPYFQETKKFLEFCSEFKHSHRSEVLLASYPNPENFMETMITIRQEFVDYFKSKQS